ncbi:hypothetical protein MHU86_1686 [Fragilaria crotonensis]|nr:hypothetical protein MHU86_1686 [Fragilaria crotonensis]
MGNRTILVTTALWLGLVLSLPQTTIAASFVASSVRPPLSNANQKKSLQSSSHRSWLVRKQQSNLSQDASSSSSSRRLFSTRLVLRQSEDGAADTELDEERDPSARVSQFAFQRSLLEARLAMEAAATKGASTLEAQHVVSEIIAEEKDSSSALQPEGSIDNNVPVGTVTAETKSLLEDVLEAINITEDVRMTASPPFPHPSHRKNCQR